MRHASLVFIFLLITLRQPALLMTPRFWAEEATVYFHYAWQHSWLDALIAPHQGYYALLPNVTALLAAKLLPLALAPLMTTLTALLVQLVGHTLIWFGKNPLLTTDRHRLLASLAIVFTGYSCELQLNIITAQFHLSLVAFLILLEPWAHRSFKAGVTLCMLLFFCVLTGVVSCFLFPAYAYRYWREKPASQLAKGLIGVMALGTIIQIGAVVTSYQNHTVGNRFENLSLQNVLAGATGNSFGAILLGASKNVEITDNQIRFHSSLLKQSVAAESPPMPIQTLIIYGSFLIMVAIMVTLARPFDLPRTLSLISFFLLLLLGTLTSIGAAGGIRYAYAPSVIAVFLACANLFSQQRSIWRKYMAAILTGCALVSGAYEFSVRDYCYRTQWPQWDAEVARTLDMQPRRLYIHPQWEKTDWFLDLP